MVFFLFFLQKELSELGSMITGKLEFLGQNKAGLSKLQILLIEIEVSMKHVYT